jgi:hypothetical protein
MIQALSIQDNAKPMVFNLINKKAASSYIYNEPDYPSQSISFGKKAANNTAVVAPICTTEEITSTHEISLPLKHIIGQGYMFFGIMLGITNLLIPIYTFQAALFLSPIFCITVLAHCFAAYNKYSSGIGCVVVLVYPFVIYLNNSYALVAYVVLYMIFIACTTISEKKNYIYSMILVFLVSCTALGVIIYQVYPKSIHGIHASFLSVGVLTCTVLVMSKNKQYKFVCGS